jgi:hypothetical protein
MKPGLLAGFGAEGLDDGGAADDLLLEAGEIGHALLSGLGVAADAMPEEADGHDADGEDGEADEREADVREAQGGGGGDQHERLLDQVADDFGDATLDELGVVEGARHELAGARPGEVEEGQAQDAREHVVAQAADDVLGDPLDEVFAEEESDPAQEKKEQQQTQHERGDQSVVMHAPGIPLVDPLVGRRAELRGRAAEDLGQAAARGGKDAENGAAEQGAKHHGKKQPAAAGLGAGEEAQIDLLFLGGQLARLRTHAPRDSR